jgi:ribulose bisphosphate carboxylase small subunit
MHADLKGALEQIDRSYKAFEHKGQRMSKEQVRKILKYGIDKGYKTTAEFTDDEVDEVLANVRSKACTKGM